MRAISMSVSNVREVVCDPEEVVYIGLKEEIQKKICKFVNLHFSPINCFNVNFKLQK